MKEKRWWEKFWEKYAPENFMRVPWQLDHPARKKVYDVIRGIGGSVLDVGCGTGVDYPHLKSMGMRYTGIDITKKFVSKFKELHPEADVRKGTALNLPFPDKHFTVVYSAGLIQHLHPDDYPKAMREMWRVCKKLMIITTGKEFTKKRDVIQKISKGRVYDNHYNMNDFKKIVSKLPLYSNMKVFGNIKHVAGEPVTVVVITKKELMEDISS